MLSLLSFIKKLTIFLIINAYITITYAAEATEKASPEVGKHVMANMDSGSMILSLLMVLALIVVSALLLKRFNFVQQNSGQLKVIASLPIGTKEKLVVVQVGEKQLLLGVTSSQITLIDSTIEQMIVNESPPVELPANIAKFFKQKNNTEKVN
ncbi:flagellar biosynthetic protein FliO [Litorilituus lipolyticus]|uniref:Flagellar protein n=1 Tax=Litorilituus lipolyticus TaxID=2491017 RepID=A0A502L425_9GAMM|nr:flagellar biosynthetic protein FliO [Litorilituus lipolyticus]TPH17175.1 flagellar biosynthetic protein FliO [Litorilituus lipolyticus]